MDATTWLWLAIAAGLVAVLYGVLYQLLQQEQTALVLGSGLLFTVLAAVMVLTRRFDWYRLVEQWRAAKPGVQAA